MSTLVKGLKRLTAQSLKFRVCLSSLGAENINAKEQVYLSVKRSKSNKKEISTANAVVDNTGKVEWKDELVQIVTIYFQFGEGNLQPAKKAYSIKVKDASTRKTLGKVKLDIRKYCKFESFSRNFVELETPSGIKIFLVISTELVDKEEEGTESGSTASIPDVKRTLSDTFASTALHDRDDNEESGGGFSSAHEFQSPATPKTESDLIQESIDILHSSSEEEEKKEKESKWQMKLQALARRLTPKATPSSAAHQRRHTIATEADVVSKTLFVSNDQESWVQKTPVTKRSGVDLSASNPFGAVPEEDTGHPGDDSDSACTTPSTQGNQGDTAPNESAHSALLFKLNTEISLLKTQCTQLQAENALLKENLQRKEEGKDSTESLKEQCSRLRQENDSLKLKLAAKEREENESTASNDKRDIPPPSPIKKDMLAELISTKMKLAEAQASLEELKHSTS